MLSSTSWCNMDPSLHKYGSLAINFSRNGISIAYLLPIIGSMSGANLTHGFWFFAPARCLWKIPSWPQYVLQSAFPWFLLSGTFYGEGSSSLSVRTIYIFNPTSSLPSTANFLSSTTSADIYSISVASTISSKGPSLNNRCISPSIIIWHHFSRVYSSIGVSPFWMSWWLKMMHPASFLCVLFVSRRRTNVFWGLCPLSMFGYFFLVSVGGV